MRKKKVSSFVRSLTSIYEGAFSQIILEGATKTNVDHFKDARENVLLLASLIDEEVNHEVSTFIRNKDGERLTDELYRVAGNAATKKVKLNEEASPEIPKKPRTNLEK